MKLSEVHVGLLFWALKWQSLLKLLIYIYPKHTIQPPPHPPNFLFQWQLNSYSFWGFQKKKLGKEKWNDLCLSCQILRLLKPAWLGTFNTSCLHLKLATSCPLCSWASTNCVLPEKKTCQVLLQVRRMWPQNQCLLGTDHNLESVSDMSKTHSPFLSKQSHTCIYLGNGKINTGWHPSN